VEQDDDENAEDTLHLNGIVAATKQIAFIGNNNRK
jgi:hypothetical protein